MRCKEGKKELLNADMDILGARPKKSASRPATRRSVQKVQGQRVRRMRYTAYIKDDSIISITLRDLSALPSSMSG